MRAVTAEEIADACEKHLTQLAAILGTLARSPQGTDSNFEYGLRLSAIMEKVAPKITSMRKLLDETSKHIPMIEARRLDVTSHLLKGTPRAVITPAIVPPPSGQSRPIQILPGFAIEAIPVAAFNQVIANGRLYYIEPRGIFAAYLNGVKYYGNVGEVVRMKQPERVTRCTRPGCTGVFNMQPCKFYHPMQQTRNWKEMHMRYNLDSDERLLGSLSQIPEDVSRLNEEDRDMFMELAFHYFLLSQALHSHRSSATR